MSCWVGDNDTSSISAIETLSADFGELLKTGDDISDVTFVIDGKVKSSLQIMIQAYLISEIQPPSSCACLEKFLFSRFAFWRNESE